VTQFGVFRNGSWYLDANSNHAWDAGDAMYTGFGQAGDVPIAGDWNSDGRDEIGFFRSGSWYLDTNGNFVWEPGVDAYLPYPSFGSMTDTPFAGAW
jgi:hypothetical protein